MFASSVQQAQSFVPGQGISQQGQGWSEQASSSSVHWGSSQQASALPDRQALPQDAGSPSELTAAPATEETPASPGITPVNGLAASDTAGAAGEDHQLCSCLFWLSRTRHFACIACIHSASRRMHTLTDKGLYEPLLEGHLLIAAPRHKHGCVSVPGSLSVTRR